MRHVSSNAGTNPRKGNKEKLEAPVVMTNFMFTLDLKHKKKLLDVMNSRKHSSVGETIKLLIVSAHRKLPKRKRNQHASLHV